MIAWSRSNNIAPPHRSRTMKKRTIDTSHFDNPHSKRPANSQVRCRSISSQMIATPSIGAGQISSTLGNDLDVANDLVLMAVDSTFNGTIGCAYYVARDQLLYCMGDLDHAPSDVLETLKIDIQPTVLLISALLKAHEAIYQTRLRAPSVEYHDPVDWPYEMVTRPPSDFKYDNALHKLKSLPSTRSEQEFRMLIPGEGAIYSNEANPSDIGTTDQAAKLLRIAGNIDLDNRTSVGCVGAILADLQRRRASEYLQHDPEAERAYRVSKLDMFTLKDTMFVNSNTLSSLHIIQLETHLSIANQGPGSTGAKESFSLYGLFHSLARTPQGRSRLRRIFIRPSLDTIEIRNRHDLISIFIKQENQQASERLTKSLGRIRNMRTTLSHLRKGVESGSYSISKIKSEVWTAILEFCYHGINIVDTLSEVVGIQDLGFSDRIAEDLKKPQLKKIGRVIHDTVDLEESVEQRRTVIKRGISEDIDTVKDTYNSLEELLTTVTQEIAAGLPPHIARLLNVTYLPQLGYHVSLPLDHSTRQPIWNGGDENWERRFSTGEKMFFKNLKMKEMDDRWGDLYAIICDAEIEVSYRLAQDLLQYEDELIRASDICGELDSLLALAHGAVQYNLK